MIFNPARDYICPLNYIVTWTDYIFPLYRPIGYLACNPVGNTLRLTLPGHTLDSREFLAHLAPRVFTIAQASLAPCRQADIFHNRKRRRAPWSISTSSPMPFGRKLDGHKACATPCIACRARSCNYERSCSKSPADAGISSSGRPVSIPTSTTLSIYFLAKLCYSSFRHLP